MKVRMSLALIGAALFLSTASAQAFLKEAYVEPATGNDGNPCTLAQPCQTVATALTKLDATVGPTAVPGTVTVLSDGDYTPITITGPHSISCPHRCAFDSSGGANGITIAADPSHTVVLSGVTVSGHGSGGNGILITAVGKLELNRINVGGHSVGINFQPTGAGGTQSHLYLLDSEIRYSSLQNMTIAPTGQIQASVAITRSRIHHGASGFRADGLNVASPGGVSVVIKDSLVSFHSNNAVQAVGAASGSYARIFLDSVTVSYASGACIRSQGATGNVALYNSMVVQCNIGLNAVDAGQGVGFINSWQNNAISFNTTNQVGTLGTITPK